MGRTSAGRGIATLENGHQQCRNATTQVSYMSHASWSRTCCTHTAAQQLACASRSLYGGNFDRKGNRDTEPPTPTVLKCNGTSLVACHILHNLHLLHPHGSSAASVRLAFVVWGELRQEGQSRHWTTDTDCVEMQRHIVSFCHMLHSRSFVAPMRQLSS